ncbi:hypothetical protein [Sinomicrobium sp. M5D2P17]
MNFYYGTLVLSDCLLILSVVLGILRWVVLKKERKQSYLYYLGFILAIELINQGLIMLSYIQNTGFIYPFYVSGEFFILLSFFATAQDLSQKWHIAIVIMAILMFTEASVLWFNKEDVTAAGYGKVISHLSIACFAGYALLKGLKDFRKANRFLLIYGCLFLYYSTSLCLFLVLNQLRDLSPGSASVIWGMNNILSSILYGASCYTFLRLKK